MELSLSGTTYTQELQVRAPGRINIIGEHTDYNLGYVLPAAIDKGITFRIGTHSGTRCRLDAANLDQSYVFDIADIPGPEADMPGWARYLVGVVAELQAAGHTVGGFDAAFGGDIPIGSGLSSSAALECGLAWGLDQLYGLGLDRMALAQAAQRAEHTYPGVKCGLMDQFASLHGQAGQVVRLDCRSLDFAYFPFDTETYRLVLFNTKVEHSLAGSEYNTRRLQCEEGVLRLQAFFPDIASLRDVSPDMLAAHAGDLPEIIYQRCAHVVHENARVLATCDALAAGNLAAVGSHMFASHDSLQHQYEVSCEELDFLVDQVREDPAVLGARMMGGGFGGCTLNLVQREAVPALQKRIEAAYSARYGRAPETYIVRIMDGVGDVQ
ncbi:MAG: galactokinase [Bacteroidetes bacterium]|nr:MAG: galactokinase [Bacteroidota bacterium]